MPPPRRKPHPRSLDALFGRPKPKNKRCPRGHIQSQRYRAGDECLTCEADRRSRERQAEQARLGAAMREEYRQRHGPAPAVLRILTVDTQRVANYAIPPHAAAQKKRADLAQRRRGRRKRARI